MTEMDPGNNSPTEKLPEVRKETLDVIAAKAVDLVNGGDGMVLRPSGLYVQRGKKIFTLREMGEVEMLRQLEPYVEEKLNDHERLAEPWDPVDYLPLENGRNYAGMGGVDWVPEDSNLDQVAQDAMIINLLTEDNLPSYHRVIAEQFGRDGAWGTWVDRWTEEEDQHAFSMRALLIHTRGVDPRELNRMRREHMRAGYGPGDRDPAHTLAYVAFQELATRISHANTGEASGDPDTMRLLNRIAKDENLHMIFYRDLVDRALDMAPNLMMRAIVDEIREFAMPGNGITGFKEKAEDIAFAGIYDPLIHHRKVIMPTLRYWKIFERDGLSGDGAVAQDELGSLLEQRGLKAAYFDENRDRLQNIVHKRRSRSK